MDSTQPSIMTIILNKLGINIHLFCPLIYTVGDVLINLTDIINTLNIML